jgi:hypothetical protein
MGSPLADIRSHAGFPQQISPRGRVRNFRDEMRNLPFSSRLIWRMLRNLSAREATFSRLPVGPRFLEV